MRPHPPEESSSMNKKIMIFVNSFTEKVPVNSSIAHLIDYFQENDVHLIVEHNGQFIYPHQYETTTISEGDSLEFINPNFGG